MSNFLQAKRTPMPNIFNLIIAIEFTGSFRTTQNMATRCTMIFGGNAKFGFVRGNNAYLRSDESFNRLNMN
jgi:hypothetical protein